MSLSCRARHAEQPQNHSKLQHDPPPLPASSDLLLLDNAIASASHAQLCQILRHLCSHSKTATDITSKLLLPSPQPNTDPPKQRPFPRSILKKPTSSSKQPSQPQQQLEPPVKKPTSSPLPSQLPSQLQNQTTKLASSPKRKATTQCRNCGLEYSSPSTSTSARTQAETACVHHPGAREVNPSHAVWRDFDPDVRGDAWTLMEYEGFAAGFWWSCCEGEVGGRGCVVGRHEAVPVGGWGRG